jgi:hypothetical protein
MSPYAWPQYFTFNHEHMAKTFGRMFLPWKTENIKMCEQNKGNWREHAVEVSFKNDHSNIF